jgi:hypothetical protein
MRTSTSYELSRISQRRLFSFCSFQAYEYEDIVPDSDLRSPDRKIWIVTTAR